MRVAPFAAASSRKRASGMGGGGAMNGFAVPRMALRTGGSARAAYRGWCSPGMDRRLRRVNPAICAACGTAHRV